MKLKSVLYFCFIVWHTFIYAQCAHEQFYTIAGNKGVTTKIIEDIRGQNTYIFWGAPADTVSTELSSNGEIWILKNDSCGRRIWKTNIGYTLQAEDDFIDVVQTPDSNLLVLGYGEYTGQGGIYSGTLFKVDPSGNIIWKRAYGGRNGLVPMSIAYNPYRNTYIISGRIERIHPSGLWNRAYIFEVDTAGNLLKEKDIFLNGDTLAADTKILQVKKNVVLKDSTLYGILLSDSIHFIRLDSNLNVKWIKSEVELRLGMASPDAFSSEFDSESQCYVMNIPGKIHDIQDRDGRWLLKVDSSGSILNQTIFVGYAKSSGSDGMNISNNGYIFWSDSLLVYDKNINPILLKSFNVDEQYFQRFNYVIQLRNGAYAGVGLTSAHSKKYIELFTMQTGADGRFVGIETPNKEATTISIYPNPSTTGIYTLTGYQGKDATLFIFDQQGQQILKQSFSNASFDLLNQPEGMYYVRLMDANGVLIHQQSVLKTK